MMRQMVGQRKGVPTLPTQDDGPDVGKNDGTGGEQTPEDSDVIECPNCKCQFNEETQDVVKPGLPLADPSGGQQPGGADLDVGDSAGPTPGPKGSAYDGTIGTQAATAALSGLFGGHGGGGARL